MVGVNRYVTDKDAAIPLLRIDEEAQKKQIADLATLDHFERARQGERLDLEVTLDRMSARAGTGHGAATVDGSRACEAGLLFVLLLSSEE